MSKASVQDAAQRSDGHLGNPKGIENPIPARK